MKSSLTNVLIAITLIYIPAAVSSNGQVLDESTLKKPNEENLNKVFSSQISLIENQNIGCLFDKGICTTFEQCLDDDLFGTCVASYADNLYFMYRIPPGLLRDLKTILRSLVERNYTWHDLFTQCCVRAALLSSSMELPTDLTVCAEFAKDDRPQRQPQRNRHRPDEDAPPAAATAASGKKRSGTGGYADDAIGSSTFDSAAADSEEEEEDDDLNGEPLAMSTFADAVRSVLLHPPPQPQSPSPPPPTADDEERRMSEAASAAARRLRLPAAREAAMMRGPAAVAGAAAAPGPPQASAVAAALSKRRSDPSFVDARYLWLQFSRPEHISNSEASAFARNFNNLAGSWLLDEKHFSINLRTNEVSYRMSPGTDRKEVANILESSRAKLSTLAGGNFAWSNSGFGRSQLRAVASELNGGWSEQTRATTTLLVCAAVIAMIVALFVLFTVQRFRSSRRKLQEMTASTGVSDSSDYRDLCRQRMAERAGGGEHTEPLSAAAAAQRHLVKASGGDGGGSPNSSTGSWHTRSPKSFHAFTARSDDPITTDMDITTGHLILSYMENYLGNKEKLEHEWADLCSYEAEQSASTVGATAENAAKNRFQDLLPYDHSRVVLKREQSASGGDYINASYIYDSDPKVKAYILTQGPTDDTAAEFWQMLWETAAVTVVNLTGLKSADGSQELCAHYWPKEGSRLFNKFEVHLVSEHIWCEDFIVRNFYLKKLSSGEARTVTMFHFLSWDEAGLPRSVKALLEFRRKVNKSYKGRASPLVVHCSDGCGRAGTYCLLDLALNRISKGVKEINLAASLEHLRDQRPGLVKTKDQFELVVTAIADEVHTVLKTLPQ